LGKTTQEQYDAVVSACRDLFVNKAADYGTAWRVLRTPSITDQIFIKAQRIKTIDEAGASKIPEGASDEFIGIVNYGVIGLIQMELGDANEEISVEAVTVLYDKHVSEIKALMEEKNHDYGEAWRDMRVSSFTDLILMKLLRMKSIEDNEGETLVSEGLDANYRDMVNYAIFALIHLNETDS
jgi:hypothetical protein